MSQNSMVIANGTGLATRTNINNAFNSIVTQFSGDTAPSTVYTGMPWLDTSISPNILKQYNGSSWLVIGAWDDEKFIPSNTLPFSITSTRPSWLITNSEWVYKESSTSWKKYWYNGTNDSLLGIMNPTSGAWTPEGTGDKVITVTSDLTLTSIHNNSLLDVDATSAAITLTLTSISTLGTPFNFRVKKADSSANTVTISTTSPDTLNNSTDDLVLSYQGDSVTVSADATPNPDNWISVSSGGVSEGEFSILSDEVSDHETRITTLEDMSENYTSSDQTITSAGLLQLPHGLSSSPKNFTFRLKCLTAQANWSIGDMVLVHPGPLGDSNTNRGFVSWADSTNVYVRFGAAIDTMEILNKTTGMRGAITNSNWALVVEAWA